MSRSSNSFFRSRPTISRILAASGPVSKRLFWSRIPTPVASRLSRSAVAFCRAWKSVDTIAFSSSSILAVNAARSVPAVGAAATARDGSALAGLFVPTASCATAPVARSHGRVTFRMERRADMEGNFTNTQTGLWDLKWQGSSPSWDKTTVFMRFWLEDAHVIVFYRETYPSFLRRGKNPVILPVRFDRTRKIPHFSAQRD